MMGAKYKSLKHLAETGVNVHEFVQLETLEELLAYADENSSFTIRFDRDKDYHQLPFYTYDNDSFQTDEERISFFRKVAEEAIEKKCTLLCSNGRQYDKIQICNFVMKVNSQMDFLLEWCTKRVALRDMYQYETSCLKGNIKDDLKDMEWSNKNSNRISDREIESILMWAFSLQILNHSIEGTLYLEKVGIYHQEIVCWQID